MLVELIQDDLFDIVGFVTARTLVDAPVVYGALEGGFAAFDAILLGQMGAKGG